MEAPKIVYALICLVLLATTFALLSPVLTGVFGKAAAFGTINGTIVLADHAADTCDQLIEAAPVSLPGTICKVKLVGCSTLTTCNQPKPPALFQMHAVGTLVLSPYSRHSQDDGSSTTRCAITEYDSVTSDVYFVFPETASIGVNGIANGSGITYTYLAVAYSCQP